MNAPSLFFKQAFTSHSINYYSFLKEAVSPEKYASSLLKYKIFCCLWATASLFHMANRNVFTINLTYFLLTCAAVALIAKPSSVVRLLVFISLQMYQAATDLPGLSNHWILSAFVNLTILHAFAYLIIKRKSFYIDKAELLETFAPLVKIELIVLYFFAVFHKLNAGFFDANASCAVRFLVLQNNYYDFLPSGVTMLSLNIYLTLIIESLIPILIIFRSTRYVGILVGLLFHLVLAYNPLNGFYDFSSTIFALYFLFTSTSVSHKINSIYNKFISRKMVLKQRLLQFNILNFVLFCVAIACGLYFINFYNKVFEDYIRHIVWTAFSGGFIIIFLMTAGAKGSSENTNAFSYAHYSLLFFPVLVFLNGLCPYLGLKTEYSYAMFSNLRTEGGVTNHYIVPVSAQIFDFQKDVVEIVSSSDPYLQELGAENKLMVYFQFRRYVTKHKPESITYLRNGELQTFELSEASAEHELLQKSWYPLEKVLQFRYFYKYGVQACLH